MKNRKRWYLIAGLVAIIAIAAVIFTGCAGAEGPAGAPGKDAAATCSECHDDTTLVKARQVQWDASVHATGGNFERSGASCAICHTSEGFTERIAAGTMEIAADIENPSPQDCRTCHEIHTTYTKADFTLRTESPVTLKLTGDTFDGGKGNLCASCHQPRWANPVPEVGGGDIEISTTRYYPHYGVQPAMLLGVGGYGESTGTGIHYTLVEDSCVTCHMAEPYGAQAGGHTMKMAYEYHGREVDNVAGCESCHADIEDFDRNGVQAEIQAKLDELKKLLLANGIMGEDELTVRGTYSSEEVGAYWNYKVVKYDASLGVHNSAYARKLLQTAIDALK